MTPEIHLVKTQPLITTADVTEIFSSHGPSIVRKIFHCARRMRLKAKTSLPYKEFLDAATIIDNFLKTNNIDSESFPCVEAIAEQLEVGFNAVKFTAGIWDLWKSKIGGSHPIGERFGHDRQIYHDIAWLAQLKFERNPVITLPQKQISDILKARPRSVENCIFNLRLKKVITRVAKAVRNRACARYQPGANWITSPTEQGCQLLPKLVPIEQSQKHVPIEQDGVDDDDDELF